MPRPDRDAESPVSIRLSLNVETTTVKWMKSKSERFDGGCGRWLIDKF